jgi:hypothetical protein
MIDLDNAKPHNSRQSQECLEAHSLTRSQHPASSADCSPSAFFIFGYPKEKLTDFDCRSREDRKSAISSIFNVTDKETLVAVVMSWMERPKWAIRKKGRNSHE